MSVIKISGELGPFKAEIDLERFVQILREITSIKLDDSTINAMKDAISEVYRAYELIVDTVTPFYQIHNEADFQSQFFKKFEKFVNVRYKTYQKRIPSCRAVYTMINTLTEDTGWRAKLPGSGKKIAELQELASTWLIDDGRCFSQLKAFHDDLLDGLNKIRNDSLSKTPKECLEELCEFLSTSMMKFNKMETNMDELMEISAGL
jgi:hypothetical protein